MSDTKREVTLFLPGLLGPRLPEAAERICEGMTLGALETLLSRSTCGSRPGEDESVEGMLFELFGHARARDADWPAAAVTHLLDAEGAKPGWYVRADPVHLRADVREVILFDASAFIIDEAEARELAAAASEHLDEAGCTLEAPHPARWYLRAPEAHAVRTHPPSAVVGANLDEFLPFGQEGNRWRRLLNEVQMALHASPANAERERRGELPVNSVWLWGAGTLPAAPEALWVHVWSDDTLALGLARLGDIACDGLPANAAEWLSRASPGAHLIADDRAYGCARVGDVSAWRTLLQALERDWFAPLGAALRAGELVSVTILTDRGLVHRCTRRSLRRWWRRRQPLSVWMTRDE
ncbi:MAG: hypothetical protein GWN09_09735 [Gammaproteobacteria bacterium]|nr:hypothetical protein [Gammaproteobacteria bacterium]